MIIPMLSKFTRVDVKRSAGWLDRPEVFCATRFFHTNLRDFVLAGVVARVEGLRGRMSEAGRQVNGLFESLLSEAFNE